MMILPESPISYLLKAEDALQNAERVFPGKCLPVRLYVAAYR
jgi:hypothetical protein